MAKWRTRWRGRGGRVRPKVLALALFFLLLPWGLAGCTWWEKNVNKRVEGLVARRLLIITDPPDAEVYVNNVFQGKTPLTLTFKVNVTDFVKGFVIIVQKDGYLPLRREVDYNTETVNIRLIRQRPQ